MARQYTIWTHDDLSQNYGAVSDAWELAGYDGNLTTWQATTSMPMAMEQLLDTDRAVVRYTCAPVVLDADWRSIDARTAPDHETRVLVERGMAYENGAQPQSYMRARIQRRDSVGWYTTVWTSDVYPDASYTGTAGMPDRKSYGEMMELAWQELEHRKFGFGGIAYESHPLAWK